MADGFFPTLVSKDANANSLTNQMFVQITDGTDGLLINGDGSLNATVTATNLDIRDLVFATDKVDVTGSTVTVTATNLDIRDLVFATDKVDVTGSSVTVTATDLDIRDLTLAQDAVKVSANSTANSYGNPIFVSFTQAPITGEVHNYNTATVAGGGTSNHDYTVVTALLLKAVEFSCSGSGKVEVQTGPVASLTTKYVGFVEKSGGNYQLTIDPPIEVPTTGTGTVRLIRTNREGASQDLYSTIIGIDA